MAGKVQVWTGVEEKVSFRGFLINGEGFKCETCADRSVEVLRIVEGFGRCTGVSKEGLEEDLVLS